MPFWIQWLDKDPNVEFIEHVALIYIQCLSEQAHKIVVHMAKAINKIFKFVREFLRCQGHIEEFERFN